MGNIVLLDDLTINKIAAGEVVERPASVIKEMVENSIDAGASAINIEIKNGGISYIRITDNGKGIASDDLEIAFERHATSKIRNASDLEQIKSMGFRGEALASIAAIANVEMISRTQDASSGNRIIVEAGKVLLLEETGCPIGTTITVQNLFFNTPVRYKFLKKDYTESGYIEDIVTRLCLIHPKIAFKLVNTGKTILQTSGNGNIQDVIYAIYGNDIANNILEMDYNYEDIHITGVVGKPEIARSNRSNQLFFVNSRYIKDKTLSSATENSFKGLLPIGKYGFVILNIQLDPTKVDVNVHPAKLEVRFQEENKVFKAVYHAIKDTLLKSELIEGVEKGQDIKTYENSYIKQTQKSNITDLFRKIKKEEKPQQDQTKMNNNVIEDIFQSKNSLQNSFEQLENNNENKTNSSRKIEEQKKNFYEELVALQNKLKEETKNNPNLHTDIDKLINDTKKIEQIDKQEETISTMKLQENDEKYKVIEKIEMDKPNIQSVENKDWQNTENMQNASIVNNILQQQTTNNSEISDIHKQQNNENKIDDNTNIQQHTDNEILEAKEQITSQEIEEMIQKIDNEKDIEKTPEFTNMYQKIFGKLPASVEEERKQEKEKINAYELIKDNNVSMFENIEEYQKPNYKFVGIAFDTYIIIEIEKELYIIDQHAAHERVMYEKVKQNYYSDTNKDSQMLLLPDIITLTHREMDILRDNYEMFEKAGFMLEEFGENTIKLTGVPNICLELDTKELFLETLDEINTVARTAKQEIEERFIATVACKAAVKANMDLTFEEVDSLMNNLLVLPNPFTCPHGRPTAIRMDQTDIEKKFARRK